MLIELAVRVPSAITLPLFNTSELDMFTDPVPDRVPAFMLIELAVRVPLLPIDPSLTMALSNIFKLESLSKFNFPSFTNI